MQRPATPTLAILLAGVLAILRSGTSLGQQPRSADPGEAQGGGWADQWLDRYGIGTERRRAAGAARHERFPSQRWDAPCHGPAMNQLEAAASQLRQALVILPRAPESEQRDRAIDQARQALIRTQNAFTWLPRRDAGSRKGGGPGRGAGGGPGA